MAADYLTRAEVNEEVDFFRDICGWSEERIEQRLGLADGTLAQRRFREATRRRQPPNMAA